MTIYVAIGLISAATLLLEISFLRLFAMQQFYHFAFMAVSLALLGAGASGSILSIQRKRWSTSVLCLSFAVTTIGSYLVINYLPFDSFSIAWDSRQLLYLGIYFLAAGVPFFFAGLVVGGEMAASSERSDGRSHRIYGANLLGSAFGSLASLIVLDAVGGGGVVLVAAVLALLSSFLFYRRDEFNLRPGATKNQLLAGLFAIILLFLCLRLLYSPPIFWTQRLSPYKTLSILSQTLDAKHTVTVEDHKARVDVIESNTIHSLPGLSLSSPLMPPTQAGLMVDGDNLMPITNLSPDSKDAAILADHLPVGLVYRLHPKANTLVLEAGTGMDVLWAQASGADEITAVEENRLIIDTLKENYGDFTYHLFEGEGVKTVNQASRVFVRQPNSQSYDVILVSLNTPHRPITSGAYSLTEDYVYTVDAVIDYLNLLDEDGLLVMTRWLQTPPSESARLFGMMAQALAEMELDPAERIIAFRSLRTMTILAGRQPFDDDALNEAQHFFQQRGFDPVYYPGLNPQNVNRSNILEEPVYYQLFPEILNDPQNTYQTYRYDIRPPTDDHPFFYHFFKWRQTPEILATLGLTWQPFGGSGFFVLVFLLILVTLAAAVFILGPLFVWHREGSVQSPPLPFRQWRVFVFFSCLGLAFLFVEIPLAQRFILSLGQPVSALAFVIFALLLFSGLGSITVQRWTLRHALVILVLLVAFYPLVLRPITAVALGWPEWARIILTVISLAPLGYFMGLPFAGGIKVIESYDPALVPWAWAINGSFSVISSVLAVIVSLTWGFSTVLWFGAAAYTGALAAFGTIAPE